MSRGFYAGGDDRPVPDRRRHRRSLLPPRRLTAYGFGLFSRNMTFEDYGSMFHGDDERVDQESLRLSTEMWHALAQDFLG